MVYVGYLLILVAGTGMGLYASHRLHQRVMFVSQTRRLLQTLLQQVGYTARPMHELWRRLAGMPVFSDFSLLRNTVNQLEKNDFAVALPKAVEQAFALGQLTESGRQLLLEFGEGCGRYDAARQEEHIAHYRDRLAELEAELRQEAISKGRVYRVMGMAGGGALVLLLM